MRYKAQKHRCAPTCSWSLPAQMRVEVELGIEVRAKTVGRSSQSNDLARKFGDYDAAGTLSRERGKGEQGQRRDNAPRRSRSMVAISLRGSGWRRVSPAPEL